VERTKQNSQRKRKKTFPASPGGNLFAVSLPQDNGFPRKSDISYQLFEAIPITATFPKKNGFFGGERAKRKNFLLAKREMFFCVFFVNFVWSAPHPNCANVTNYENQTSRVSLSLNAAWNCVYIRNCFAQNLVSSSNGGAFYIDLTGNPAIIDVCDSAWFNCCGSYGGNLFLFATNQTLENLCSRNAMADYGGFLEIESGSVGAGFKLSEISSYNDSTTYQGTFYLFQPGDFDFANSNVTLGKVSSWTDYSYGGSFLDADYVSFGKVRFSTAFKCEGGTALTFRDPQAGVARPSVEDVLLIENTASFTIYLIDPVISEEILELLSVLMKALSALQ
jgi:hypothetical protein